MRFRRRLTRCCQVWGIAVVMFLPAGCSDFFSQQPTEIQTNRVLHDLSKIEVMPNADRPYPEIYVAEPKVVAEADGMKLFYFSRHQPTTSLLNLIKEQYPNFLISENPSTNQLVVKCANQQEVDVVLTYLERVDIPPLQIKVDCLISEIFADVTMDYETTADITDLFGEDITLQSFLPGASVRSPSRSAFGMKAGLSRKDFDFLIDILVSRGYAKILMRPTLQVLNGTTARIETNERVPVQEKILSGGDIIDTIKYVDVSDYLEIKAQVYADGTIGLETSAGISSRTIPQGVEQAPIITIRTIKNEENRLHKGQSLMIGGIRKNERVSVIRGVPFLKDLPLIGMMFSSKDFEDTAKEILFILTPSISSYGEDYAETVENIKAKHTKPEYTNFIKEMLADPFGTDMFLPENPKAVGDFNMTPGEKTTDDEDSGGSN